jgi:hypothetical protein
MSGKSRLVRCKQSYVNHIDNNTASGPMKMGTSPSVGVTKNFWCNYNRDCNQQANATKKTYNNMVFLNVGPGSRFRR